MTGECRCAIAHHDDLLLYDFYPSHPLRPERLSAGLELLEAAGLWDPRQETVTPSQCSVSDLELVHDPEYIRAVEGAGSGLYPRSELVQFGLTSSDNPAFPDMHYASALVCGATLDATRAVMDGTLTHTFIPAGGLHHALRARASGFCVYNDPAVASARMLRTLGARVFYVDFDCHHGDGVQWLFYGDPGVMTVSFHESGRFLFPGTGSVEETGEGRGSGYSVNIPFAPFTQDADWLEAVDSLLPPLVERFAPDLILSNHGCDTHLWDPQTHLSLSTTSFRRQAQLVHDLAHAFSGGRLVAVGSGGYDWRRVVPRSWSIIWAEVTGRVLPTSLPRDWSLRWSADGGDPMPETFLDGPELYESVNSVPEVARANRETLQDVRRLTGAG